MDKNRIDQVVFLFHNDSHNDMDGSDYNNIGKNVNKKFHSGSIIVVNNPKYGMPECPYRPVKTFPFRKPYCFSKTGRRNPLQPHSSPVGPDKKERRMLTIIG